jgi:hypothetical protein
MKRDNLIQGKRPESFRDSNMAILYASIVIISIVLFISAVNIFVK